jgi:S-adenosylmethionine synthetase
LNRPFCSEAAAGKNPVSHVGKIYNFLTFRIAQKVCDQVKDIEEVYIWLLSKIGAPIDHPTIAAAQVVMKDDDNIGKTKQRINEVLDKELENIQEFCMELAEGKIAPC